MHVDIGIVNSSCCHLRIRIDVPDHVTASEHGQRCDPEYLAMIEFAVTKIYKSLTNPLLFLVVTSIIFQ